jgi:L-fuculose-phosphate aldolase
MIGEDGYQRPDAISVDITLTIKNHLAEFIQSGDLIDKNGLAIGSGGNTSIKVPGGMLITSTGSVLSDLKPEEIVFVLNVTDDAVYYIGSKKPSSEALIHWFIYKNRPDIKAVAHVNVGQKDSKKIKISPKELPYGTVILAKKTASILKKTNIMMMNNHGVVAIANTLLEATNLAIDSADKNKINFKTTIKNKKIKINYLLVDIHGVLTTGDERKKFISKISKKYKINSDKHNELWINHVDKLDIGLENGDDYIKIVNQNFNTNISKNEYFRLFSEDIVSNKVLIKKLTNFKKSKVCIVSDNLLELSQGLNKALGTDFKNFQKLYSFEIGKIKSQGMLEEVLKLLKTEPGKCLFIDDSERNIKTARKIGIHAILFKENKGLFDEFKKYQL